LSIELALEDESLAHLNRLWLSASNLYLVQIDSPDLINQVTWEYSLTDVPADDGRFKTC
jgi:hypothetical protein